MRLDGPPKWKMKKLTVEEFENAIGSCEKSVRRGFLVASMVFGILTRLLCQYPTRYSTLYITSSHVNVRYSEGGEFKFSGSYGVPQPN